MAGNWKMNLNHLEAIALTQKLEFSLTPADYEAVEVAILPPFTDIRSVQTLVDGDRLRSGVRRAGPVAARRRGVHRRRLRRRCWPSWAARYVVVGHSERRQHHQESDELVNAKAQAARCGTASSRSSAWARGWTSAARAPTCRTASASWTARWPAIPADKARTVVVAYEPVWAIGTGEVATPEDAQEVCAAIRGRLADLYSGASVELADHVRVLYGGSVKAANIAGIMAQPDVDGALVGGASLDAGEFAAICQFHRTSVDMP